MEHEAEAALLGICRDLARNGMDHNYAFSVLAALAMKPGGPWLLATEQVVSAALPRLHPC
jgi:hypothetical protein